MSWKVLPGQRTTRSGDVLAAVAPGVALRLGQRALTPRRGDKPGEQHGAERKNDPEYDLHPRRRLQVERQQRREREDPGKGNGAHQAADPPAHHRVLRRPGQGFVGRATTGVVETRRLGSVGAYHLAMARAQAVRVVLVDDHDLLRRGIKTMLESDGTIEVVGEASDGDEAVALAESQVPDVVLIDVIMPKKDGIEATREIKATFPHVAVVMLTGHEEEQFVFDALKAGASGYLLKTSDLDEVVDTVRAAARGEGKMDAATAAKVLSEFQNYQQEETPDVYQPLTPREREILKYMGEGLPNKSIATKLSISERTVTTHVANIYAKLHVNNRVSAIQEAMRRRILDYNP